MTLIVCLAGATLYYGYSNGLFPSFNSLDNGDTNNYYYEDENPDPTGQSNSLMPTQLSVQVSPNPMTMGGAVYGSVTSNGYNTPITVYARHTGADEWTNTGEQSFGAFLGADGKYEHVQQLNVPGFWEFYAIAGPGVVSNTGLLTCMGVAVSGDASSTYPGDTSVIFVIFSSHKNVPVVLIANDPVHMTSVQLQTANTDDTGAVSVMYNFNAFAAGTYEIDAVVGGEKASDYGGSFTLTVH